MFDYMMLLVFIYIILTVVASGLKVDLDNCDKHYPIDYIIYGNLFCEEKEEK